VAEHQPAGERAKAEDRDQPCCVPAEPRPREQREGSYERSGRGARETTGTRLGRAAETSGRGRACEESWKTVEIKMSAANPGGAGSNSRPGSRNRPPRARQDESYAPTLVFDQPSREQRHQERTEPSARQGDAGRNPAIAIEPGLHRRNRGRVADRQPETKTRAEGDGTGCWVGSCR